MAEINKPSDINKIWASAGDVLAPSDSKIATGWQVEIPARQFFNYIDNKQDQAIAHINQHGIAVWDNNTEYQYSVNGTKSLCMGSDGIIYRAKAVNTAQDPVLDTGMVNWAPAFSTPADTYTKTASDARYLQLSNNLSDVPNTATARTNLSVYSQIQVDGKTTKATAAQAQAQIDTTSLLSPFLLGQALKGANQSLAPSGFQKLPGGFILQWAKFSLGTFTASGQTLTVTWPIPFPNALVGAAFTADTAATSAYSVSLVNRTNTQTGVFCNLYPTSGWVSLGDNVIIAIGY